MSLTSLTEEPKVEERRREELLDWVPLFPSDFGIFSSSSSVSSASFSIFSVPKFLLFGSSVTFSDFTPSFNSSSALFSVEDFFFGFSVLQPFESIEDYRSFSKTAEDFSIKISVTHLPVL
jgi:hypothetical protein